MAGKNTLVFINNTVLHGWLGESVSDVETGKKLVKRIAHNSKLPYFTLTPTFSICKNHGYLNGEVLNCPTCKESTEIYSRVVGYIRPVQSWNFGKKEVFSERKTYNIKCWLKGLFQLH